MLIKVIDADCKPIKKYNQDAGWDLVCRTGAILLPGEARKIPAGVCVDIPTGCVGKVQPRGSSTLNSLVVQGTVDPGYRGELHILVINAGNKSYSIHPGDRIAQLEVQRLSSQAFALEVVDELPVWDEAGRGTNGFGSTGR